MTIDDLIKELEAIKKTHGNIPVKVETLSHTWSPDLVIKTVGPVKFVVLNG